MTKVHRSARMLGRFVLALTAMGAVVAYAQSGPAPVFPSHSQVPLAYNKWLELQNNPKELSRLLSRPAPLMSPAPTAGPVKVGPWQSLTNPLTAGNAANPLLLNDGTVIVHIDSTPNWWKLTPNINGSYVSGTWSRIASLPSSYGPRFFASQVLTNGQVEIEGGEYNLGRPVWTTMGAVYNPVSNSWKSVNPPSGWSSIGDAQSIVLNNRLFMQADCCDLPPMSARLNPHTSTWRPTGSGKFDAYDEEGWTLLPDGNVLTVDAYVSTGICDTNSEIYNTTTGVWTSAGSTIQQLADCNSTFSSFEMGPQVLRPDGTVIAFGATTEGTARTDIYNSSLGTWAVGPDLPVLRGVPYILADAPAALEPSGSVLFAASPGNWRSSQQFPRPTHFFEVDLATNTITKVTDNPDAPHLSSFEWNFLVLPTGQILAVETDMPNIWIYTPSGSPNPAWAPTIATAPSIVSRRLTYHLTGTQFNGLSQGAFYGDDVQGDTDRPIVAIVNNATGHVFYQLTSLYTISLASGAVSSAKFMVTPATETGASSLYVIANGISSAGVAITVR